MDNSSDEVVESSLKDSLSAIIYTKFENKAREKVSNPTQNIFLNINVKFLLEMSKEKFFLHDCTSKGKGNIKIRCQHLKPLRIKVRLHQNLKLLHFEQSC